MKRILRWVGWILLCLLLLAVALVSARNRIFKAIAERRIRAETGVQARIGYLKTGLGSATIALKDIQIFNPPEFGSAVLMEVRQLYLELDAQQAAANKLRFKVLRLHLSELNVVRDKKGRLNLEALQDLRKAPALTGARTNANPSTVRTGKGCEFGGIGKLYLTLGKVTYTDLQQPKNNREFILGIQDELVTNIQTAQELDTWMKAFLIRIAVQEYVKARTERGRSKERGLDLLWKWLGQELPLREAAKTNIKSSP
jgi:uncharacterized protein involved in outer membrane biogenesis